MPSDSYLRRLRRQIGSDLLLMPGARCVLLNASGRVLLQKRSDFSLWGLPGGNAEPAESLYDVAVREIREEVGLDVPTLEPFGFASDPRYENIEFPNGDRCQFFVLLFWAQLDDVTAYAACDESLEVGWFELDAIPSDILPNMHRTLTAFQRFQQCREFQMI